MPAETVVKHERDTVVRSLSDLPIWLQATITCTFVFISSYFAAELGGLLALRPQMIWPFWPGCAFLVAVLLTTPRKKIWPGILAAGLAGFALYDFQTHLPLRSILLFPVADAVEILIAALGVEYAFRGTPRLDSLKAVAKFSFFAVFLAPISVSSIVALAMGADYRSGWSISFLTEALALLTLTPAALGWFRITPERLRTCSTRYVEAALMFTGLVVFGYITFIISGGKNRPALLYSLVPFLLWAALRFGITGISNSMLVVSFLSISGTIRGRGPFTGGTPISNVFSLQLFILVAATSFIILAALVEEHKKSEQELRESEQRFRLVADTAPALIWMSGTDKLCTYFNKTWLEFTGRSIEDELGNGWAQGVHPGDLSVCLDTYTRSFDRRERFAMEYRLRRNSGEYRWILDIGTPRFNQDGSFAGYIGIAVDVSGQKAAAEELSQANERLYLALEAGSVGGLEWDIKSGKNVWFGKTYELMGIAEQEYSGSLEEFWDRIHPEDQIRLQDALENAKQNKMEFHLEFRILWADGSVHWLRSRGRYVYAQNGEPEKLVGISADITAAKLAELALRQNEERLRLAARAGKMYGYEWDVATDEVIFLGDFRSTLGQLTEGSRLPLKQLIEMVHPDDRERVSESNTQRTPATPDVQVSYRFLRPDGSLVWLEETAHAFFDETGKMTRMTGMVADITERKLADAALLDMSRKLVHIQEEERKRIARDLHDDINQRLALLAVQVEQLKEETPDSARENKRRLSDIWKQIFEVSSEVQSISHQLHSKQLEYIGIVAAMRSFCSEFSSRHKVRVDFSHVDVRQVIPQEISLCLFRILQEALSNAAKYSGEKHFQVKLECQASELRLRISDAGIGFDSYAATRAGLGLLSMRERVRLVNGNISINSKPMGGTTIQVRVPMAAEQALERTAV
jgi:PAS domain S-box-containing protein